LHAALSKISRPNGGVLPGFGDQREIELLVEAGFTPVEAIRIATLNGAIYEGKQDSSRRPLRPILDRMVVSLFPKGSPLV
jgi:hypothetical protein